LGILAYRWAAFAWMVILAIGAAGEFRRPAVAWLILGATGLCSGSRRLPDGTAR
jgi:hypothetical protein